MGTLGSIPIADRTSEYSSGAAFLLAQASRVSETVYVAQDSSLELRTGVEYAIARSRGARSPEEALTLGHRLAQQGLDLISILGKDDLTLLDSTDDYMVWWREQDKQVLRVVSTSTLNFDVPPVRVVVHDRDGNEVVQPEVRTEYHYAFRYFRLSQITEDLYDAYRNMYLAFELLLSSKYPKGSREREIDWLQRGIEEADSLLNLSSLVSSSATDAIQTIIRTIYYDARLPLFHAKEGRDFYLPQSSHHHQAVLQALQLLTKMVLRMSEVWYQARRLGGGVTRGWVYRSIEDLLSRSTMLMSDDTSEFDPSQSDLGHERYKTAVWLDAELVPNPSGTDKGPALLGRISAEGFDPNASVRRFEVVDEKAPLVAHILKNALTLAGIDQLEWRVDTRVSNIRQPKYLFAR
jgi:hypothetical protein